MRYLRVRVISVACLLTGAVLFANGSAFAEDWPTWRHDGNRSGSTSEELPASLSLQWQRDDSPLTPAWPEDPRIHFDASYEPVVMGGTLFVASSRNDSMTAIDVASGAEKWRFYADGPLRFAPVAASGKLYFGADDGCFYCLNANDGRLLWKFRAAPNNRKVLGNTRLISVWPMRGGPVLDDGKLYFTVGVWPSEGTFLYTLDAQTGRVIQAENSQAIGLKPPKPRVTTLKDLTPQGYLTVAGSKLFIPCGRSVVGCLERDSGKFLKFTYPTSMTTNYHVTATGRWLFHGLLGYDVQTLRKLKIQPQFPVFTNDTIYFAGDGAVQAYDLKNPKLVESKDRRGRVVKNTVLTELWRLENNQIRDVPDDAKEYETWIAENLLRIDMKAGSRLYGHQQNLIFALETPQQGGKASVAWKKQIEGTPSSMLAANGKLYVVTQQGRLYCFGGQKTEPKTYSLNQATAVVKDDVWADKANQILAQTGVTEGYCVVLGVGTGGLIDELARQSKLQLIVIDPDANKIAKLRKRFDSQGRYGTRVVAHVGHPLNFGLPPYLASLVVSEDPHSAGLNLDSAFAKGVFHCLRPYGGTAALELSAAQHDAFAQQVAASKLPKAGLKRVERFSLFTREGSLPGSADWTHEYADAANTLMSRDQLVKAPLGVLWFGGPSGSGELFYNRHYWGPSLAVIGGRMFIQGPSLLTAVDVYTGRILWKIPLKNDVNYKPGRRGNDFEKVLAGYHFLAIADGIYLVNEKHIMRYDPATGKTLSEFKVPDGGEWGRIRVQGDVLVASVFRRIKKLGKLPVELVAMDRHSGQHRWTHRADLSYPVVAVSGDKVYCFDGALEDFYRDAKRKGLVPKAADQRSLIAIDLNSGDKIWKYSTDIIATWLSYSEKHDVLMVTNQKKVAAFRGKNGRELWKKYSEGRGFKGHPENLWDKIIVIGDRVIDQRGPGFAYDLETGESITRLHPITNKPVEWEFTKSGHHCNYAIASPHLMTFRAHTAGICELPSGNTTRLEGFRTGCRNSLIPANGVLNSPNFAHGCVCGFPLFTSLAFVHLPEVESWSYNALELDEAKDTVERVGINFGAPGDRLASNGTLWLDYPNVGGSSPKVAVNIEADKPRWFRQHSSLISGDGLKWVAASGVEGVSSVTIRLNYSKTQAGTYTVRLHFSEPDALQPGERVFSVALQGKQVLEKLDLVRETGQKHLAIVKEFPGIRAVGDLRIELKATSGKPILCGVEIVADERDDRPLR